MFCLSPTRTEPGSILGVVTALCLDGMGFNACQGQKTFLFSEIPKLVLGPTQPTSMHAGGTY
jgi:hypothetical protein